MRLRYEYEEAVRVTYIRYTTYLYLKILDILRKKKKKKKKKKNEEKMIMSCEKCMRYDYSMNVIFDTGQIFTLHYFTLLYVTSHYDRYIMRLIKYVVCSM